MGNSYVQPEIVLTILSNDRENVRVGVAASRSVGNAVKRNRARRRIRAIINQYLPRIKPGWDIVIIARRSIHRASPDRLKTVINNLLTLAELFKEVGG
ncbi:MAG: ribonuclease P protein component [Anaerolineaceae bacterium]|nr:ribonuclease P protein component [Anaerolineaceae bacterium]